MTSAKRHTCVRPKRLVAVALSCFLVGESASVPAQASRHNASVKTTVKATDIDGPFTPGPTAGSIWVVEGAGPSLAARIIAPDGTASNALPVPAYPGDGDPGALRSIATGLDGSLRFLLQSTELYPQPGSVRKAPQLALGQLSADGTSSVVRVAGASGEPLVASSFGLVDGGSGTAWMAGEWLSPASVTHIAADGTTATTRLAGKSVTALLATGDGGVWVLISHFGYDKGPVIATVTARGQMSQVITLGGHAQYPPQILLDRGAFWVAARGGVIRASGDSVRFLGFHYGGCEDARALAPDGRGGVWFLADGDRNNCHRPTRMPPFYLGHMTSRGAKAQVRVAHCCQDSFAPSETPMAGYGSHLWLQGTRSILSVNAHVTQR